MMFGFITKARHDREMAAKEALVDSLDTTAAMYKRKYETAKAALVQEQSTARYYARERDAYKAEVDRLRPVRGDRGRFTGKARRLEKASPPAGGLGSGMEDCA